MYTAGTSRLARATFRPATMNSRSTLVASK